MGVEHRFIKKSKLYSISLGERTGRVAKHGNDSSSSLDRLLACLLSEVDDLFRTNGDSATLSGWRNDVCKHGLKSDGYYLIIVLTRGEYPEISRESYIVSCLSQSAGTEMMDSSLCTKSGR